MGEPYPSRSKERRDEYNKQYYQENSAHIKSHVLRKQKEIRDFIRQQKVGRSCKRCGIDDIRVLDFHHINPDAKEFRLAMASYNGWSKERILQEIAKCEVLCANCHRILHWHE